MVRPKKFFGLHAHTGASAFDGMGSPKQHFDFVLENGGEGMAITEHGHMNSFASAFKQYNELKKDGKNFKYIPGVEAYFHPDLDDWAKLKTRIDEEKKLNKNKGQIDIEDEKDSTITVEDESSSKSQKRVKNPLRRRHHLVVLPKNSKGLEDLFSLISFSYVKGQYFFPRIDMRRLKEKANGNLVVLTACLGGPFAYEMFDSIPDVDWEDLSVDHAKEYEHIIMPKFENLIDKFVDAVGEENFFLELQFNKLNPQHAVNYLLLQAAKKTGVPLTATADSHYPGTDKWKARELYRRLRPGPASDELLPQSVDDLKCELYPKNADQMWDEYLLHRDKFDFYNDEIVCSAIERSHDIATKLIGDVEPDRKIKLPGYTVPEGEKPMQALARMAYSGLQKRGFSDNQEYLDRLVEELKMIKSKKFAKYFLTMKAIMDLARDHMLCGFGRGSAAGSLVCYCLEITGIDPIKYGLLFSRFLSKNREDLPDVDSDVSDRDKLRKLLAEKFGEDNVVAISNVNTLSLKSLTKDIAKFYGIEFVLSNEAVKDVDFDIIQGAKKDNIDKSEVKIDFDNAMKYSLKFASFIEEYPLVGEHIKELRGEQKAIGRHAGGIILSENIVDRMPVILSKKVKQTPWTKDFLEPLGWVKYDILGLETLSIIERCIELILQRHEGIKSPKFSDVYDWYSEHLDPHVIDLDDQNVYENVYHNGNYAGTFQVTTVDTQKFFTEAKPTSIVEIAALTSIYRPGPMGAGVHMKYIKSKANPESVVYQHEKIKEVLEPTFGHLCFQEQAMSLGNIVGGMNLDDCDTLRKVVSKKPIPGTPLYDKTIKLEKQFVEGALSNGIEKYVSQTLFDNIKEFSKYSFNKSHAVSYAINSYICAWLLTYYEAEWLCSYVESQVNNVKDKASAISELKSFSYDLSKIDVNYADGKWTILEGKKKLMPSFVSCKGLGVAAVTEIKRKRPYRNIYNFLWDDDGSWKHSKCNKKVVSNLVKIGAFESLDCVGENKLFKNYAHMHKTLIDNWDLAKKKLKKCTFDTQVQKLDDLAAETDDRDWSLQEKINISKELLGETDLDLIMSKKTQNKLLKKGYVSINEFPPDKAMALTWFVLEGFTKKKTKNGKPYLLLEVSGLSGKVERVFLWDWSEDQVMMKNKGYLGIVDYNGRGFSTKMNQIMEIT